VRKEMRGVELGLRVGRLGGGGLGKWTTVVRWRRLAGLRVEVRWWDGVVASSGAPAVTSCSRSRAVVVEPQLRVVEFAGEGFSDTYRGGRSARGARDEGTGARTVVGVISGVALVLRDGREERVVEGDGR
jgi:hypothetical protein